jgi:hypothetical protein
MGFITLQIMSVRDILTDSSYPICNLLTTLSNPKAYSNEKRGDNKTLEYNNVNRVATHSFKLLSSHLSTGSEK